MDAIVIGGGIAGLVAAATLGREGRSVMLLEQAPTPGGRARSENVGGAWVNLGPHAVYNGGHTRPVCRELGVEIRGGEPPIDQFRMVLDDRLVDAPFTPWMLARSNVLSLREKWEFTRFLGKVYTLKPGDWEDRSFGELLDQTIASHRVRELASMVAAIATYAASDRISAGTVLSQLRVSMDSVTYPHQGWQSIVDGLVEVVRRAGVEIRVGARVGRVEPGRVVVGGSELRADSVIVATPPGTVEELTGYDLGPRRATRMATLDVVLERPTGPMDNVLDPSRSLYLSFHSPVANLGDGVVLHVAKYLEPRHEPSAETSRPELEALLERVQPGWRDVARHERFLPRIAVNHWFCDAEGGGRRGRPDVFLGDGVFVAGDWVGPDGMLADAAAASGERAARAALDRLRSLAA